MQKLAENLIKSIKSLENYESLSTNKIENDLLNIKEVLLLKLPLKINLLSRIINILCLQILMNTNLDSFQLKIQELLNHLLEYDELKQINNENKCFLLLISKGLDTFLLENQSLNKIIIENINKICKNILKKEELNQVFPRICSVYFKGLNKQLKLKTSNQILIIDGLQMLLLKLFPIEKKIKNDQISQNLNFLFKRKSDKKSNFCVDAETHLCEFFSILCINMEKLSYKQNLMDKFTELIIEILSKTSLFSSLESIKTLISLFALTSTEKSKLYMNLNKFKEILDENYKEFKLIQYIKEKSINSLNNLQSLENEIDSNIFLKKFNLTKIYFLLLNFDKNNEICNFSQLEIEKMADILINLYKFSIREKINISLNTNSIIKEKIDDKIIDEIEEITNNFFKKTLVNCLKITNFDDFLLEHILELPCCFEIILIIQLYDILIGKLAFLNEENQKKYERIASIILILNIFTGKLLGFEFYEKNWIKKLDFEIDKLNLSQIQKIHNYKEIILEINIENSKIGNLINILRIDFICKLFYIEKQYSYSENFNLFYFLIENLNSKDYLLNLLIEKHIIYLSFVLKKILLSDFLKVFSCNLLSRTLLQIKSIELLKDKSTPFKILENFIFLIEKSLEENAFFINFSSEIIENLTKVYDNYYLLSSNQFQIYLLQLIISILNYITKKSSEIKEVNFYRQILLRIKPLFLSKNKEIIVFSNEIFIKILPLINNKPMNIEDNKTNFSTEDPINVIINDSLAVIAAEFFDIFIYILEKQDNLLAFLKTIETMTKIAYYKPEFFNTCGRIEKIWDNIKLFIDKKIENPLKRKIITQISNFISLIKISSISIQIEIPNYLILPK